MLGSPSTRIIRTRLISCFGLSQYAVQFFDGFLRSHAWRKELFGYKNKGDDGSRQFTSKFDGRSNQRLPLEENSSNSLDSPKSFGDTQLEIFHHRHGMLILHLVAALMFATSLVAWLQYTQHGYKSFALGYILHSKFPSFGIKTFYLVSKA